ncbi:hypothetical protein DT065_03560 [Salicibibacter kimchii]|uniref:Uncharacterized protein n=1 Tax=Salicibibacter kimchii TaxID=2099786 RepID=A0A345BW53_9BACI|nr:hypothetical protein DT065_03560 [Salicibibacter kimchii]
MEYEFMIWFTIEEQWIVRFGQDSDMMATGMPFDMTPQFKIIFMKLTFENIRIGMSSSEASVTLVVRKSISFVLKGTCFLSQMKCFPYTSLLGSFSLCAEIM